MNCMQCGGKTTTARENFAYSSSGLPNITLVGVEVSRCRQCGEFEVSIPRIEDLHRAIALAVVRKPAPVTPAEVRYLRKWLGWSGMDFAAHIGVAPETVSRWENGGLAMRAAADRALRLMVVTRAPLQDYSLELLKAIDPAGATTIRIGMRVDETGWHAEAA